MALSLNKPKLDNLTGDIWKSDERLRGKFKAYEYQSVILPNINGHVSIYDPTCSTGGMLSVAKEHLLDRATTPAQRDNIERFVTGQLWISEADVARSQLSENTGQVKLEPSE